MPNGFSKMLSLTKGVVRIAEPEWMKKQIEQLSSSGA